MGKRNLQVQKGVPVPPLAVKQGANIALLTAMEPGDSVWWTTEEARRAMRFYRVAKKLRMKILIRKVGAEDPNGPGVRMWRAPNGVDTEEGFEA